MLKAYVVPCCLLLSLLAGCSALEKFVGSPNDITSGTQKASITQVAPFPQLDAWLLGHNKSVNAGQSERFEYDRAFAQGEVIVYGEGKPLLGSEGAQKRLTAIRAAEVVAQRTLSEYFVRHASNGEVRFSTYSARMEALLKGATVVASEYNADLGKAAVLLRLDLRGAPSFAR